MVGDVDHTYGAAGHDDDPGEGGSGPAQTRERLLDERDAAAALDWNTDCTPREKKVVPAEDLADAMVAICGEYLSGVVAAADNPDIY